MDLSKYKHAFFLGIGGIGMSALARFLLDNGLKISGYDRSKTFLTEQLEEQGISVYYEDNHKIIIEDMDLFVYTPAIPDSNKIKKHLISKEIRLYKRSEILGVISKEMECIAIAGTHGKTTTSSMLTHVLHHAEIYCYAILGGIASNFNNNYVKGDYNLIILEADEYDRSFLTLEPDVAVITSTDPDHLDIYYDKQRMLETGFWAFLDKVDKNGIAIVENRVTLPDNKFQDLVSKYGLKNGDYYASNIRVKDGHYWFNYHSNELEINNIKLAMPGKHNIENAIAVISIAIAYGADTNSIKEALATFKGIRRRFDILVNSKKSAYVDDYAHHPTEIDAAILTARELFPERHITGIFQPHLYSRTSDFMDEFAKSLSGLDRVIVLPIYPARELPIDGVSSAKLYKKINNKNKILLKKNQLIQHLENENNLDVLITLGAGDIENYRTNLKQLMQFNETKL